MPGAGGARGAVALALGAVIAHGAPAAAQDAPAAAASPASAGSAAGQAAATSLDTRAVGGIAGPDSLGGVPPVSLVRPEPRLGGFLEPLFGGAPANLSGATPARGYVISPSLTLQFLATDNSRLEDRRRDSEFVTSIIPAISVTADSATLRGTFRYAPRINLYANGTEDNRVDQNFLGIGTLALVPDSVFVDLRALGTLQPVGSGVNDVNLATARREGFTQNYYFTVSPYAIQRWGSTATSVIGYRFAYSRRDGDNVTPFLGGPTVSSDDELTTHTGYAAIRTGEEFGRLVLEARAIATAYVGGGEVTDGAERALGVLEARYGITRTFAVLGEIGYEHLNFGGLPPYRVDGMVWAGGVRLDPSPNTTVIARYRRRDGFDSPAVEARIGIGQRTVLFGSYIEQVTTSLSQISDLLTTITVDEFGNPIGLNGAPVPDFGSTGFLGQQNGLYRSRRGTASISHLLPRDTFTLQYVYDRRTPVSVAPGNLAFEQQSQSLSLLWRRAISPLTTGFGSVGYTWYESETFCAQSDTITARIGVVHSFSERLVGSLQYQFTGRLRTEAGTAGALAPDDTTQNTVIASITTRF